MKKSFLYMAAFAALCVGCQKEDVGGEALRNENTFTASFESNTTRAYLDEEDYCRWELNDQVSFFNDNSDHYLYYSTKDNVITTDLSTDATPDFSGEKIYAIFPYLSTNKMVDGVLHSSIAAEQVYNKEKVGLNNAIMVSHIPATAEKYLSFKNSCALVKVELNTVSKYVGQIFINSIKVESKNHKLAGDVTVNGNCVAEVSNGSNAVTLTNCEDAGALTTDYTEFVLVIPAGTYEAGDLTITVDASEDAFDYQVSLNKNFTVNRSEYVTLHTTLSAGGDRKVNEAIVADIPNLMAQKFPNVQHLECEYALPGTPEGENEGVKYFAQDADGGYKLNGEGRVFNFNIAHKEGVEGDIYIMNTFTTTGSGIKNTTPPTVTVNDITITGTLRGTTMGIWVKNGTTNLGPDGNQTHEVDQKAFRTIFNNVNIVNNNIIPWTAQEAAALGIFGEAVLNNCVVKGTKYTEQYADATQNLYDVTVRNGAHATFNGGEYDLIHGKEQSQITVTGGVIIDELYSTTINYSTINGFVSVDDATIREMEINTGKYCPKTEISKNAKITTLKFGNRKDLTLVSIEEGAQIDEVIIDGESMTLADFRANYLNN